MKELFIYENLPKQYTYMRNTSWFHMVVWFGLLGDDVCTREMLM